MQINYDVYRLIRAYRGLTLKEASEDICTSSALSQFEKGKINLIDKVKYQLNKRYKVDIIPHTEDIYQLQNKTTLLKNSISKFEFKVASQTYDYLLSRIDFIYYDMTLLTSSFTYMAIFDLLVSNNKEAAMSKINALDNLFQGDVKYNNHDYYALLMLKSFLIDKDLESVRKYYQKILPTSSNSFIKFWYAKALMYFNKNILAMKSFLESSVDFRLTNSVVAVMNLNLSLADLMLSLREYEESQEYIYNYINLKNSTRYIDKTGELHMECISSEIAYHNKDYRKSLRHLLKGNKLLVNINDPLIKDRINSLLLKVYKNLKLEDEYQEHLTKVLEDIDKKNPSILYAYILKETGNNEYIDYINKVVMKKYKKIPSINLKIILIEYEKYLDSIRKYSYIAKLNNFYKRVNIFY